MEEEKDLKNTEPEEDKLAKLEREREEYLNGWKRAKADLINYKKEEAERLQGFVKFSNEALITELLAILDSFELSLSVIAKDDPARKGVELMESQLQELLRRHGLERIQVKPGDQFDPKFMEAVGEVSSGESPGTLAEEISGGYRLHERVVRPARVKISKGQNND